MSKQTKTVLYQKHLDYITPLMWNGARSVSFSRFCQRLRDGRTIKKAIQTPADLNRCSKEHKKAKKNPAAKTKVEVEQTQKTTETSKTTQTVERTETSQKVFDMSIHTENKIFVPRNLSRADKVRGWVGIFLLSHFVASAIATIYEAILAAAN